MVSKIRGATFSPRESGAKKWDKISEMGPQAKFGQNCKIEEGRKDAKHPKHRKHPNNQTIALPCLYNLYHEVPLPLACSSEWLFSPSYISQIS